MKLGEKTLKVVDEAQRISEEVGRPISQMAINWVQQQSKAQMIPLLGARSVKQRKDNLGVLDWKLTDEQWKCLDEVSAIDLGLPHGFWMAIVTSMGRRTIRLIIIEHKIMSL